MRDGKLFGIRAALPRMSWHPQNLYNLWQRTERRKQETVFFKPSSNYQSLFQQRWVSKRLTRAYHGDFINEKIFKRWYLPRTLPDVRPRKRIIGDDTEALAIWSARNDRALAEKKAKEEEERQAQAPVGSLMFIDVERRIDVFIFRCCFAHSVYEARRLVIHGDVLLNGKKHQNANTRLAPGDMVSVDPKAIRFLQPKPTNTLPQQIDESAKADSSSSSSNIPIGEKVSISDHRTPFNLPSYAAPFIFIPAYIQISFLTCSAIFLRYPTARNGYSEIPTPYEADGEIMRLTWEWYSRNRPRMRSRSQLARMPDNRREERVIPLPKDKPVLLDKSRPL